LAELAPAGLETVAIASTQPGPDDIPARLRTARLVAHRRIFKASSADHGGACANATCFRRIDLIVDGGAVASAVRSTPIVGFFDATCCLRPGGVRARRSSAACLGRPLIEPPKPPTSESAQPLARELAIPLRASHQVRLHADSLEPGEALLAWLPCGAGIDRGPQW